MSERKRDYPSGAEKRKIKQKRDEVIKKVPKISSFFQRQDTVSDLDWKDSSEACSSSHIHPEIEESQAHTLSDVHPEIEEPQVNDSDISADNADCNIISSDRGNFGFIAVTDCSAAGLKTVILNLTKEYGIDLTKCRGQGYDGANVMSGVYGGLQTLIKEHAPNADYVHCAAHALNLVLNDAARHVSILSESKDSVLQLIDDSVNPSNNDEKSGLFVECSNEIDRLSEKYSSFSLSSTQCSREISSFSSSDSNFISKKLDETSGN
ncbi:unnamed protein product, partial [Brenthis ino]